MTVLVFVVDNYDDLLISMIMQQRICLLLWQHLRNLQSPIFVLLILVQFRKFLNNQINQEGFPDGGTLVYLRFKQIKKSPTEINKIIISSHLSDRSMENAFRKITPKIVVGGIKWKMPLFYLLFLVTTLIQWAQWWPFMYCYIKV